MVRFINLLKKLFGLEAKPVFLETNWLLEQIELRKKEWQEAWLGFHQCETADNDYWIFKLKTAERSYMLWLDKARQSGLRSWSEEKLL